MSQTKTASPAVKTPKTPALWATGRRKTAIARVRMISSREGGKIFVNKKSLEGFFGGNERQIFAASQSLAAVKNFSGYDLHVKVSGGGLNGQAEAIRHGIARVLSKWNDKVRVQMRKEGYLTRDPRAVERKKSGQPKARKRFQYSKR